jgi:starvation-inducible outer membrane lipoprotein
MKMTISLFYITLLFSITACNSVPQEKQKSLPTENTLPQVPNCAADGPECKQFNPNL